MMRCRGPAHRRSKHNPDHGPDGLADAARAAAVQEAHERALTAFLAAARAAPRGSRAKDPLQRRTTVVALVAGIVNVRLHASHEQLTAGAAPGTATTAALPLTRW